MAEPRALGPVITITAEAVGQPGQRRFRIKAITQSGTTASLWLEKEQLVALGDAIETVLSEQEYAYRPLPMDDAQAAAVFPLDADIEFRIGQLSMGIDRDSNRVVLIGAELVAEGEEEADAISLEFDYRLGYELRREITGVVAAGRPPCPLCTAPMDPQGHVCPRTNGHHPQ